MRIDRRLTLIGVMLVVLSMTMATQFATTRLGFTFGVVHPSDSDIRFIGSDNASDASGRVLRVTNNASGSRYAVISLGDWMPGSRKNYTAAFGIVNEEGFTLNITHINVSGSTTSYMSIWLHGDRDADAGSDSGIEAVTLGTSNYNSSDIIWVLGTGNGNPADMSNDSSTQLSTPWDSDADVRYSINDANNSVNGTSDFVWVQVSLNVPKDAPDIPTATGTLFVHFKTGTT